MTSFEALTSSLCPNIEQPVVKARTKLASPSRGLRFFIRVSSLYRLIFFTSLLSSVRSANFRKLVEIIFGLDQGRGHFHKLILEDSASYDILRLGYRVIETTW